MEYQSRQVDAPRTYLVLKLMDQKEECVKESVSFSEHFHKGTQAELSQVYPLSQMFCFTVSLSMVISLRLLKPIRTTTANCKLAYTTSCSFFTIPFFSPLATVGVDCMEKKGSGLGGQLKRLGG